MADLLMCGPSCWICSYVGLRAENVFVSLRADVFVAGFGNLPVQGGAAEIFNFCLNYLHFFFWLTCNLFSFVQHQSAAVSNHCGESLTSQVGPSPPGPSPGSHVGASHPSQSPWAACEFFFMYSIYELVDYELWFVCCWTCELLNLWTMDCEPFVIICCWIVVSGVYIYIYALLSRWGKTKKIQRWLCRVQWSWHSTKKIPK